MHTLLSRVSEIATEFLGALPFIFSTVFSSTNFFPPGQDRFYGETPLRAHPGCRGKKTHFPSIWFRFPHRGFSPWAPFVKNGPEGHRPYRFLTLEFPTFKLFRAKTISFWDGDETPFSEVETPQRDTGLFLYTATTFPLAPRGSIQQCSQVWCSPTIFDISINLTPGGSLTIYTPRGLRAQFGRGAYKTPNKTLFFTRVK